MQKTLGPLVIDLAGTSLQPEEQDLLAHPLVGGVILFTRNYQSIEQLRALIRSIRGVKEPLLIMVDQEGGRVQRFRQHFTSLPPAAAYAQMAKANSANAAHLAKAGGWLMATEILSMGIDLSLAPLLDIDKGISAVIGDRAYGENPVQVIALASAFIEGMKEAGMAATGKHFPGHGGIAPDSHHELPIDTRSWEMIEKEDLQPFIHFINHQIPALMTAHILFPAVDSLPVSFSRYWLQNILRERLGFQGVIMSDDLNMKGADQIGDYSQRAQMALAAGCDLILLCNNRSAVIEVVEQLNDQLYLVDDKKYALLKGSFPSSLGPFSQNSQWQNYQELLSTYHPMA